MITKKDFVDVQDFTKEEFLEMLEMIRMLKEARIRKASNCLF